MIISFDIVMMRSIYAVILFATLRVRGFLMPFDSFLSRKTQYISSSLHHCSKNAVFDILDKFSLTNSVLDGTTSQHANTHLELLKALIRSDVIKQDSEECGLLSPFPPSYIAVIKYIDDEVGKCRLKNKDICRILDLLLRKEGFQTLRKLTSKKDLILPIRDVIDIKRRIERILSCAIVILSVNIDSGSKIDDVAYFGKILMERVPIQDKHFALLILYRGIMLRVYQSSSSSIGKFPEWF